MNLPKREYRFLTNEIILQSNHQIIKSSNHQIFWTAKIVIYPIPERIILHLQYIIGFLAGKQSLFTLPEMPVDAGTIIE